MLVGGLTASTLNSKEPLHEDSRKQGSPPPKAGKDQNYLGWWADVSGRAQFGPESGFVASVKRRQRASPDDAVLTRTG
jgi:hypothetical protein